MTQEDKRAMHLSLHPVLERFIHDKVKAGEYASAVEVIEAGLARLMLDPPPDELDEQDLAAIRESLAQMRRGEGIPLEEAIERLRKKHFGE